MTIYISYIDYIYHTQLSLYNIVVGCQADQRLNRIRKVQPRKSRPSEVVYLNWQTFEVVFLIFAVLARHGVAVEPRIYRYVACRSTALTCVVHTVRLKILRFRACKMLFRNRNFVQKSKFGSKIEILIQNLNLVQKLKFCSKIEIWFKNWNFAPKSKFGPKIEILFKNQNLAQKLKFCSKIEILLPNLNLVQKLKFCLKIQIWFKNWNFGQKLKFGPKNDILFKNRNLVQKLKFCSKVEILLKIEIWF